MGHHLAPFAQRKGRERSERGMPDGRGAMATTATPQNTPGKSLYFTRALYSPHFSAPYFSSQTLSSSN